MLYTTGEVTKRLNISRPTLYKLCKDKRIRPSSTPGGNYRYSDEDLKRLLEIYNIDTRDVEDKFVNAINEVWIIFKKMAEELWGIGEGERKLREILENNKSDIFLLNSTSFK